jgi:hypothetical protein
VILDDDAPPAMRTLKAGYESRRGYHRAADVIPVRETVYRDRAKIAGTLAFEASRDGVTVYEGAEASDAPDRRDCPAPAQRTSHDAWAANEAHRSLDNDNCNMQS